jgi:hypothetical protein
MTMIKRSGSDPIANYGERHMHGWSVTVCDDNMRGVPCFHVELIAPDNVRDSKRSPGSSLCVSGAIFHGGKLTNDMIDNAIESLRESAERDGMVQPPRDVLDILRFDLTDLELHQR